jgi:MOSC domain-containing protein YiiM
MSTSGKTGFYFRVLKQGYVSPNDQLYLIQEAPIEHRLSVQQLNDLYYNHLEIHSLVLIPGNRNLFYQM